MKRDLSFDPNSIELCSSFFRLYFDLVLSPVFQYKVLVAVFSFSISVLYQGWIFLQPWSGKTLPTCFVLSARSTRFLYFYFYVFFHGVCKLCKLLQRRFRRIHIQISKSTLHSLKSVFNVFTRKTFRGTQRLFSVKYLFCLEFLLLEDG